MCFDISNEEENIENPIANSEFPFYTDNSCNKTPDDFKVPHNSLLDEDKNQGHHQVECSNTI